LGAPRFGRTAVEEAMTLAEWAPLVDIIEEEKEYRIKAELPR
jgi:HSP20 family molecular chaperone IbpA